MTYELNQEQKRLFEDILTQEPSREPSLENLNNIYKTINNLKEKIFEKIDNIEELINIKTDNDYQDITRSIENIFEERLQIFTKRIEEIIERQVIETTKKIILREHKLLEDKIEINSRNVLGNDLYEEIHHGSNSTTSTINKRKRNFEGSESTPDERKRKLKKTSPKSISGKSSDQTTITNTNKSKRRNDKPSKEKRNDSSSEPNLSTTRTKSKHWECLCQHSEYFYVPDKCICEARFK